MNSLNRDREKCQRCGKEYPIEGIMVCPCSSIFLKNDTDIGGYFEFKDEENLKKGMAWFESQIEETKAEEKQRYLELLPKKKLVGDKALFRDRYEYEFRVGFNEAIDQAISAITNKK